MSTLYNLEPNPTAKALLRTTAGDIELELFAKQTPVTSRNFLQLCLDGYYDNTIFHRLVPGFILQGGDPTGTGHGGESSYDGSPFEDEYNDRLKFNRRGLLGMANEGKAKTNGSQFFMTLGPTPELQKKNTLFGRVVGDTIFNLMRMGEAQLESEGSDRPAYPSRILSTEILVNPFENMVRRVKTVTTTKEVEKPKKAKRKAGKNVLSFGGDEGEDDIAPVIKKAKYNSKLVSAGQEDPKVLNNAPMPKAPKQTEKPRMKRRVTLSPSPPAPSNEPAPAPAKATEASPPRSPSPSTSPEPATKPISRLEKTNAQIAQLKESMKRNVTSTTDERPKKQSALDAMIPATSTRGRKRRQGGAAASATAEQEALSFLSAFRAKLDSVPAEVLPTSKTPSAEITEDMRTGEADEEAALCDLHFIANCQSCSNWDAHGEEAAEDDAGWMSHSLSFAKDRLGKDLEWKRKNEDELVVIDPREKLARLKGDKRGGRKDDTRGKDAKAKR